MWVYGRKFPWEIQVAIESRHDMSIHVQHHVVLTCNQCFLVNPILRNVQKRQMNIFKNTSTRSTSLCTIPGRHPTDHSSVDGLQGSPAGCVVTNPSITFFRSQQEYLHWPVRNRLCCVSKIGNAYIRLYLLLIGDCHNL